MEIIMKHKLIVIEGACDGIGKSTQFALLREKLEEMGAHVVSHHFPSYGTPHGASVEAYLRGEFGEPETLSPYFVNSLYAVDRAVTYHSELKARREAGDVILLDRYTTSSLIYQSAFIKDEDEKNAFIDYVTDLEYVKLGIPAPDAVIFLDAPYDAAKALRAARKENDGVERDIHETDDGFMRLVYDSAQHVCDRLGWTRICCTDDCGNMRTREEIHADIMQSIMSIEN